MSFLALPFLFAALAAVIPLVLHMINRQKAKELPFSTLRFLKISVQKTRRRKRVHDLLLMLLRMAVLVLIAVGLARPTVTSLSALWGGESTAVAIILDNSASMGMIDQERVRFRTALGASEQVLDQLRDGDPVAIYLSGGRHFPEEGKLDRTHDKVRQILRQWIEAPSDLSGVTYERADLGLKVQAARKLLADVQSTNKQIYVICDMQAIDWASPHPNPLPKGEGTSSHPSPLPEGEGTEIPIIIVDCNRAPKPNVAVQKVEVEAAVPVAGLPVRASVELLNASSTAQSRHVELYIDGSKEDTSPALSIPPEGRVKHDFHFTFKRGGLHRGEVRLAGDDGSQLDDRRFFAIEVDQGIPVAVVKPQRHEIPYLEDTFYVEQALSPGKSGSWAIRANVLTAGDLLSTPLGDYKVVFCVNLPAPQADVAERLRAYVAGGGNLVWICGDNVQAEAYNQMNQQAGERLLPLPLLGLRTPPAAEGRDSWSIGFLDKKHPALSQLVEPESLFRSVLVYKHIQMDAAKTQGAWVLARLDDGKDGQPGAPLLVERNVEKGKVLMLGVSGHVGWSNLPLRPIFLPMLVRLTFDLAGMEQRRYQLLAGAPLELALEDAALPVGIEVVPPSGEVTRLKTEGRAGQPGQVFRYTDTHDVGIYVLRPLETARQTQLAYSVNVDPDEAIPAKIEREELKALLAPTPLVFAENPDDLSSTFAWLREGKGLWEFFLAAVLIGLVFETFISNRLSPKQDTDQTQKPPPGMRWLAKKSRPAA